LNKTRTFRNLNNTPTGASFISQRQRSTANSSNTMAATTMAAALAASLPAPQSAPTPSAPTLESLPASMAKLIDIEAEIPISAVQVDGLVR
jgi:hypothetical protein